MSLLLGLLGGLGLALIADWWFFAPWEKERRKSSVIQLALLRAGITTVSRTKFIMICCASAIVFGLVTFGLTSSWLFAVIFMGFGLLAPWIYLRHQAAKRQAALQEQWPEVVDHLRSAIRAGLSLPESLSQLATVGPEALRPVFKEFALDYRATANFSVAINQLSDRLADPIADKIITTLRITREVGGTDLGLTLSTLAAFLRDDVRTRGELAARQSWIVSAARLAVAAPWILLLVLGTQPAAKEAYMTPSGVVVLGAGLVVSFVCYRVMLRLGTLPVEERVLS
ncbi:type II secretion system protein F [Glutamicibacter uratoxydans]|uniref:Type II secretion system protein F n=1 Tax=Glutamicibacter uratoxydans TaxID=43667 RepID=A0A4Y4DQT6_GLUUR|nr:type II secretion system F family protein [Glutamicibacter uratoxydans]GED06977.1 type II secretion system protein F [Glutamicibacter uratoxydans]